VAPNLLKKRLDIADIVLRRRYDLNAHAILFATVAARACLNISDDHPFHGKGLCIRQVKSYIDSITGIHSLTGGNEHTVR